MPRSTATSIDEYIAEFPADTRSALEQVRNVIREAAPEATETIAYAIPTFDIGGRHLVHFGAFEHHIGFYPTPTGMTEFADALAPYKQGKGSVQFPLDRPMPDDLIYRIVSYRVAETLKKRPK